MALEDSFTTAAIVPISTVLFGPVDADGARGLSLQIQSMGTSGSLKVQQSLNGVTWNDCLMQAVQGGVSVVSTGAVGAIYWTNLVGRYYRVIMTTATTAGTTTVSTRLNDEEFSEMGNAITAYVSSLPSLPFGTNMIGSVQANMSATTGSGVNWSISRLLSSLATTNATVVKASGGRVGKIYGSNCVASAKYLKLYNKASAPTVGTDVPVMTFFIRANTEFNFDVADLGIFFGTGIAYAFTNAVGDADSTAIAAGDIQCLNILYI